MKQWILIAPFLASTEAQSFPFGPGWARIAKFANLCTRANPCIDAAQCIIDENAPVIGQALCVCPDGFTGSGRAEDGADACVDVDECSSLTHTCDPISESCHNTAGAYECRCKPGFMRHAADVTCTDIDECLVPGVCPGPQSDITCVNTVGSFDCQCHKPFKTFRNGACVTRDLCNERGGIHNPCDSENGICEVSNAGVECYCKPGFRMREGSSSICEDVDECEEGTHRCPVGVSECANTPGSYTCNCIEALGYANTAPRECGNLNECETFTDVCADPAFPCCADRLPEGGRYACLAAVDSESRSSGPAQVVNQRTEPSRSYDGSQRQSASSMSRRPETEWDSDPQESLGDWLLNGLRIFRDKQKETWEHAVSLTQELRPPFLDGLRDMVTSSVRTVFDTPFARGFGAFSHRRLAEMPSSSLSSPSYSPSDWSVSPYTSRAAPPTSQTQSLTYPSLSSFYDTSAAANYPLTGSASGSATKDLSGQSNAYNGSGGSGEKAKTTGSRLRTDVGRPVKGQQTGTQPKRPPPSQLPQQRTSNLLGGQLQWVEPLLTAIYAQYANLAQNQLPAPANQLSATRVPEAFNSQSSQFQHQPQPQTQLSFPPQPQPQPQLALQPQRQHPLQSQIQGSGFSTEQVLHMIRAAELASATGGSAYATSARSPIPAAWQAAQPADTPWTPSIAAPSPATTRSSPVTTLSSPMATQSLPMTANPSVSTKGSIEGASWPSQPASNSQKAPNHRSPERWVPSQMFNPESSAGLWREEIDDPKPFLVGDIAERAVQRTSENVAALAVKNAVQGSLFRGPSTAQCPAGSINSNALRQRVAAEKIPETTEHVFNFFKQFLPQAYGGKIDPNALAVGMAANANNLANSLASWYKAFVALPEALQGAVSNVTALNVQSDLGNVVDSIGMELLKPVQSVVNQIEQLREFAPGLHPILAPIAN